MLPPLTECRPVTFDVTVELPSMTYAFEPCARIPSPPLSNDELRSTVMEVIDWPAAVEAEMPLKALPDDTLSRIWTAITPVLAMPLATMPLVLFSTRVRSITTRAEPDPAGWMKIPPPLDGWPLLLITLSDT